MRKSILGILLILLALLILFQALFVPALIDGWALLGLSFTAIWFLGSLLSAAFTSSFLGLAFFLIILNSQWHFLNLPNATICLIAFLAGLGLDILFRGKKAWRFRWRPQINNSYSYQPYTSHTVHIRDDNFISDGAEVSFGKKVIYLDEAVILGDIANFEVAVSFASMVLYIPRDWSVVCKVSSPLGSISLPSQSSKGSKTLELTGRVAFGNLEVIYL
ncbi:hypothetical protein [Streptococcus sobrinus]|uniref:hypothetical protein n=1 Tax=Streptococcus sobrinus TaxID=1310 RepID=UPI00030276B2|nr:hypothetical protein [Streptococcus sobrinus]AWN18148.1 hypothetical protein DK181_01240 [Streptococcus sobrinus]